MLDLSKQCPELLQQIDRFPNDGSGTHLEEIYTESKLRQTALRKALGWKDEQTSLYVDQDINLEDTFKLSKKIILSLLNDEDERYLIDNPTCLWDNRLKSGMKVTKAIARNVSKNEHVIKLFKLITETFTSDSWETIKEELPKFPDTDALSLIKDPMVFVQNFMSEIASVRTKHLGFTIDMFDFLRGCNSPNYASCYTISRNYNSMAPISLALSGKAGMIFSGNKDAIIGRCWVIFSNTFDSFAVLKSYGFLPLENIHSVACNICGLLKPNDRWVRVKQLRATLSAANVNAGLYGDPLEYGYSSHIENNKPVIQLDIDNPTPICIICGKRTLMTECVCPKCKSNMSTCKKCSKLMFDKPDNKSGLCTLCASKVTICPDCGKVLKKGAECTCKSTHSTCTFCDSPTAITINGVSMCEDCSKIICTFNAECAVCGSHGPMYPYKKHALCQRCYACVSTNLEDYREEFSEEQKNKIREILEK